MFSAGGGEECTDGFGGAALATEDFAEVVGIDAQLDNGDGRAAVRVNADFVRAINEGFGDDVYEFFHRVAPQRELGLRRLFADLKFPITDSTDGGAKPPHSEMESGPDNMGR